MKVEQALGQRWDAREAIARSAAKAEQTQLWDGLVHDKVLGALRLAARPRAHCGAPSCAAPPVAMIDL